MKGIEYYIRIDKESFYLKGTELRQWVSEQMKLDRQLELDLARAKEEEAEKVRKHEAEEAEKLRQHELELASTKKEEAEKVRQHELELAKEAEKVRQHEAKEAEKVRQHEAKEAEKVRQHELKILEAKLGISKGPLERDISDKPLVKPPSTASYDDSQSTQYQKGAGRASRGKRGNYGFSGIAGRGNGDWRSGNTQQSGGRGSYNPPDSRICHYCSEKGHIRIDCLEWKERVEAFVSLWPDEVNVNQDPCHLCELKKLPSSGHTMLGCHKLKLEKVDDVKTVAPSEEKVSAIPKVEKYFLSSVISSSDVSRLRKRMLSQLEYLSASAT